MPEKDSGIPCMPEFFSTAWVVSTTAKIASIFIYLSAVHTYDFQIFTVKKFSPKKAQLFLLTNQDTDMSYAFIEGS